jgi:mono/diheme cytochrome c family protein
MILLSMPPAPRTRLRGARLAAWAALAAPGAALAADAPRIAAYTVINGAGIEAPLAGLRGNAGRGATLFADAARGACASCHSFAGEAASGAAPAVILSSLAPEPEPEPEPEPVDEDPAVAPEGDATGLAPLAARHPLPRGTVLPDEDDAPAPLEPEVPKAEMPPGMALPMGPALDGARARLGVGGLRLWIVDPALAGGGAMPGFHAVDYDAAARAPDHPQPWLSAQEVEDILAYLIAAEAAR